MSVAIALFLAGACAGGFLVFRHFTRRGLPGWVAVAHGLAGAAGFAALLLFCAREPAFVPARSALAILVVTIGLGCANVVFHLRRIRHRTTLIVAHALSAFAGVGTLTYAAFVHASAAGAMIAAAPVAAPSAADTAPAPAPVAELSPPAAPAAAAAALRPGFAWTQRSVDFAKDSAVPIDASQADLAAIADDLRADPGVRLVEVQGHADERGADAQNVELTRSRARAVVDALVARGVDRSRLRSAGYGSRCAARPVCRGADAPGDCHDESSWRLDRRAAFLVLESSGERFHGEVACERAADLIPGDDAPYRVAGAPLAARE